MRTFSQLLSGRAAAVKWLTLTVLTAGLAFILARLSVPAALLLGSIVAGIALAAAGGSLEVPQGAYALAQGLVGCMIAKNLPASVAGNILNHWPTFAAGVALVIAASGALGWVLARLRVLPGTTVLWGLSPGAATAMVLMAENYGADAQLVAFMQYLRVILVAAVTSLVARLFGLSAVHALHHDGWFACTHWAGVGETMVLAALGAFLARAFRVRAGALLIPLGGGIVLAHYGWATLELPRWLLAFGYAAIGWRIGLRFTLPILLHAARALPRVLASTLALIAFCAGVAALLVIGAGVDPLTAYLATSPGGADSVAIIAASCNVDRSFVMAMQTARFLSVLFIGPVLAAFIASRLRLPCRPASN
jgi:membrane AbrB-like protein